MNRWWIALLALSLASGWRGAEVPFAPELEQALALIQAQEAHALGFTGRGISVIVIDQWRTGHGNRVVEVLRAVAPDVAILKVDWETQGVQSALDQALDNLESYQVVNLSWSLNTERHLPVVFKSPCALEAWGFADELDALARRAVLVAGAGNSAQPNALTAPACHPGVISVGASYDLTLSGPDPDCPATLFEQDFLACFSNEAPFMDLIAPGREILLNGKAFDGTSAAAPLVSGAIALMLQANPRLTGAQVRDILHQTGAPALSARTGRIYPRLNVLAAVQAAAALKLSLAAAARFDANDNGLLDDREILHAVRQWAIGAPVPAVGGPLNDATILDLVRLWVTSRPWRAVT